MQTHHGSCHCEAVKFSIEADIESGLACNCSHCQRKGFLLAFIPKSQFTLESGDDNLTEYRFNKKKIAHLFCKTCGVQCFGFGTDPEGNETVAVNLRTISDIDLSKLAVQEFNGRDY